MYLAMQKILHHYCPGRYDSWHRFTWENGCFTMWGSTSTFRITLTHQSVEVSWPWYDVEDRFVFFVALYQCLCIHFIILFALFWCNYKCCEHQWRCTVFWILIAGLILLVYRALLWSKRKHVVLLSGVRFQCELSISILIVWSGLTCMVLISIMCRYVLLITFHFVS